MKLDMRYFGGSEVLAGALSGRRVLAKLLQEMAAEPKGPEPVFLDFSTVDVATASFLRESVLAFRDTIRGRRSNYYPVVANANAAVRDELLELVRRRGNVLMACTLSVDGRVSEAAPIGELDTKQRVTFELVRQRGETDASELMRAHGESEGTTHTTAWNNRLSALTALGLVVETSQGRAKRYRVLFEEA